MSRPEQLGPDHPDTANALNNLACLRINLGQVDEALVLARRCLSAKNTHLSRVLGINRAFVPALPWLGCWTALLSGNNTGVC